MRPHPHKGYQKTSPNWGVKARTKEQLKPFQHESKIRGWALSTAKF